MGETPPAEPADQGSVAGRSPSEQPDMWESSEPRKNPLARTRVSEIWGGVIVFAVILVLLGIFVLQNTRRVEISYLGADFTMPLAVAMLLSAAAGILLAATAGTLRILQLRHRVRKDRGA